MKIIRSPPDTDIKISESKVFIKSKIRKLKNQSICSVEKSMIQRRKFRKFGAREFFQGLNFRYMWKIKHKTTKNYLQVLF